MPSFSASGASVCRASAVCVSCSSGVTVTSREGASGAADRVGVDVGSTGPGLEAVAVGWAVAVSEPPGGGVSVVPMGPGVGVTDSAGTVVVGEGVPTVGVALASVDGVGDGV